MELAQLRYFAAVADALSFTEAAAKLRVSQPALSYQIKQLENELGARLFDRTSRKVSLTVDGSTFLPLAQTVLLKAEEATRVMEERLGVVTGSVRFGCIPSAAAYLVPPILASFAHNWPGIQVTLVETGAGDLERSVLDGSADFAIISDPHAPELLEVTELMEEDLLLVLPHSHRLAHHDTVSVRELEHEPLIILGGAFTLGPQVLDLCRHAGFEPRVAYETGALESVKSFVRNGLGIAVLPRMGLNSADEATLTFVPFAERVTRRLNLIRSKDRYATVASRTLMVHVRAAILSDHGSLGESSRDG
ncbi:MAG TPA: LysR family transcriptional regulator [Thermoleophilia bacterium]|nr:LysR family transcriptional regulator [Thermoleophilia bacterium]